MVEAKIEEVRSELFDAIDNCNELTSENVVGISQKLDELINMYYKKNIQVKESEYSKYENELEIEWKRFVNVVMKSPGSRHCTACGWERCRNLGIREGNIKNIFLTDEELNEYRIYNSELIDIVEEYMDKLSCTLSDVPHIIALSDKNGWIIDIKGTMDAFGGSAAGLCKGANWSESNIGNNGIGTCLAQKEPVLVYGIEHIGDIYKSLACFGVPIKKDGIIVGALDVTVPVQFAQPSKLILALDCVELIEYELAVIDEKSGVL